VAVPNNLTCRFCETGGGWLCLIWPKRHPISVVWRCIMSLTHIYTHKSSLPHNASSTWCSWALGRFTRNAMGREGARLRGKNRPWLRARRSA
jgi:hypothetical protein